MLTGPIVIGVDGSTEAAKAAAFGVKFAELLGSRCQLVHAVPDTWSVAAEEIPFDLDQYNREIAEAHRTTTIEALKGHVPDGVLDALDIRMGRTSKVIKQVCVETGAGLVIMGGKKHPILERWLSGSTVHQVLHSIDVPMLVTGPGSTQFTRILAAVDLSYAAGPTIKTAQELADILSADLWVMNVVDSFHNTSMVPLPFDHDELVQRTSKRLESEVWPLIERPETEKVVASGRPADAIAQEVSSWNAALVVMGSHGKGWTERVLLGSTTERLLNNLPAAVLVIPVQRP
ncbi:MAG: universal stress protein [Gemmatimonadota bacterium]|nr:universal stress protein [Gemmatimonadota bacterium]